jgi:SNF2 family DNA or RNA helicase
MILLHAGIDSSQFFLWGETPAELPPARPNRKAKSSEVQAYPFDAGVGRLVAALLDILPGQTLPGGGGEPPLLWLPTIKGRPIPSSGTIADVPTIGSVSLVPWKITALPLPLPQVIDLLCACVGRETLGPGLLIGTTLAFWTHVLRLAGSLVARERFVPSLRRHEGGWRALWQPAIIGPDGQRLAQLAHNMPAACRALSRSAEHPPDIPAALLLRDWLDRLVDSLVRLATVGRVDPASRGGRVAVKKTSTLHDDWVFTLNYSPDGLMTGPEAELAALADQVRSWQRPITVSSETPFGLCFRLEEPSAKAPPSAPWKVRYLLQARDDPSLFIPVADAWKPQGSVAQLFQQRGFNAREFLLTTLGQAANLCPPVERSLKHAAPAWFETDVHGAHRFLNETAYLMEQSGFTVQLPSWWTRQGTRERLGVLAEVLSPPLQASGGLSLDQLINFDWQIALGGEPLSLQELQRLAQIKSPLIKVRGQWIQVDPGEIQAALDLLQGKASGQATLREVVQMALGGGRAPGGLPFAGVKATGWVADFLSQLEGKTAFAEVELPAGFTGELRPYQRRGYSWLVFLRQWGLGACLADDMGLGKTVQTLVLLLREWQTTRRPSLLICPTSVVANWQKEAERFTPELPVLIHHGGSRQRGAAFIRQAEKYGLVVSSYALLYRDRELLEKVPWAGVILDEAQNIKNAQTKQAQAARALSAEFRIALTGTPVENHVGDLWSILEFLNPGWLGTSSTFRKQFFVPIQAQQDAEAALRLKRLTSPFILRRLKTDRSIIADLPDKLEMKVFCTLTREQATLYQAVVNELHEAMTVAEGIQRKGIILATLTKLKQVCNHPAHFLGDNSELAGRSGKLARLTEMLEDVLQTGDRALVFTQFTEMGELLKRHLQETFGREVLFLHGGTPREQRNRMVERFQNEATGPRIFLLSLKAGGTGLNLTAASHVFHFDRWWNPAVEDQATDRAYRIGQDKCVQVHKFVCAGTIEEKIDSMIDRKQAVATQVVGTGEDWLTELSNEQLRDLFALRQDAIGD